MLCIPVIIEAMVLLGGHNLSLITHLKCVASTLGKIMSFALGY